MRVAKDRPGAPERVRQEFKKNAVIPKKEIMRIEHLIRRSERQLEMLKKSTVSGLGVFQQDDKDK